MASIILLSIGVTMCAYPFYRFSIEDRLKFWPSFLCFVVGAILVCGAIATADIFAFKVQ